MATVGWKIPSGPTSFHWPTTTTNGKEEDLDEDAEYPKLGSGQGHISASADIQDSTGTTVLAIPKSSKSKGAKQKWIPLTIELPPLKPRRGKGEGRTQGQAESEKRTTPPKSEKSEGSVPLSATTATTPEESSPIIRRNSMKGNGKGRGNKSRPRSFTPASPPSSSSPDDSGMEFGLITSPPLPPAPTDFLMPYLTPAMPDFYHHQLHLTLPMDEIVLSGMLRNQIEYYFSEENLSRDFYLRRKMDSEGYLPIHLIASFQRVQHLTQDFTKVLAAVEGSCKLEVKDGCVRTMVDPLRWPIVDSVPISPVTLMPPQINFTLPPMSCAL